MGKQNQLLLAIVLALFSFIIWRGCHRSRNDRPNRQNYDEAHQEKSKYMPIRLANRRGGGEPPPEKEKPSHQNFWQTIPRILLNTDLWLVIFTGVLAYYTSILTEIADRTDKATQSAATAANDANKLNAASLRPWVTVMVSAIGPLTFDDFGAHLQLNPSMINLGKSPARSVLMGIRMIPKAAGDAVVERGNVCNTMRKADILPFDDNSGFYLFPNQQAGGPRVVTMRPEDLAIWRQTPNTAPAVVGCIEYYDNLFNERHNTEFMWELDRRDGAAIFLRIDPNGGTVLPENLMLGDNPFMPWAAN